ncbi:MAG: hypothetical protein E7538_07950 [Ruminococcaceae bacterium]|nr:hypothetical protein [Oscillospiraceae bacterium]
MRILLLDDKKDRTQDVEEIANDYKFELITSHSLEDAETKLKHSKYDIVIIDLVVPSKYNNRELSKNAGFELVKYIYETTDDINMPHSVVVVSDNLKDVDYLEELNYYPVSIIDTNMETWTDSLRMVIDNCLLKIRPIDIAIITAVDVEFNALYNDCGWTEELKVGAITFYQKDFVTKSKSQISAVLVQTEDKGMVATSFLMSKLFEHFMPKNVFMIGISAGNPDKTNFGDIIVATSCCDYSKGAITDDENGNLKFESEPSLVSAPDKLVNVFKRYSLEQDLSYEIRKSVKMNNYNTDIKIKLGLMACGPLVVKSKTITDNYIRPYNKNYLGIDMESFAVYSFCQKNKCESFIVIKSVSDHGDRDKTHTHQEYCSKLSAELLKHYIYNEL